VNGRLQIRSVLIVARALSTHPWQAADKLRTDGREHQSRGRSRIRASPFGRQTSISDMADVGQRMPSFFLMFQLHSKGVTKDCLDSWEGRA
jgi:hypothetical protein